MSYSNEETYDMLLILGGVEVYSVQQQYCGKIVFLIGLFTRATFFHDWLTESEPKESCSLIIIKVDRLGVRLGMKEKLILLHRQN